MRFTAKAFKRKLSRKRKQRRQRTRRLKKYSAQGGGIPNTIPSIEDLEGQGAVFANPQKVDDYLRDEVIDKA